MQDELTTAGQVDLITASLNALRQLLGDGWEAWVGNPIYDVPVDDDKIPLLYDALMNSTMVRFLVRRPSDRHLCGGSGLD